MQKDISHFCHFCSINLGSYFFSMPIANPFYLSLCIPQVVWNTFLSQWVHWDWLFLRPSDVQWVCQLHQYWSDSSSGWECFLIVYILSLRISFSDMPGFIFAVFIKGPSRGLLELLKQLSNFINNESLLFYFKCLCKCAKFVYFFFRSVSCLRLCCGASTEHSQRR